MAVLRGLRLVRFLQGARRGLCPHDLPLGLAQGALSGPLPGRCADPRSGDVPEAVDLGRGPALRGGGARPRRQRQSGRVRGRTRARGATATASGCRSPTYAASTRPRSTASSPASRTSRCPTSGVGPGSPSRSPSDWCSPVPSTRSTTSAPIGRLCRNTGGSPPAICCWPSPISVAPIGSTDAPCPARQVGSGSSQVGHR